MTQADNERRALEAIVATGATLQDAEAMLRALRAAGLTLADEHADELVVRWIDVNVRPVPPEADTIIRTITRTVDGQSWSTTHWLEGLRSPRPYR